jgi:hypothetical protein
MKNRKAKLMKNQRSSDINSMVTSGMNNASISLAMPVCTALIWGLNNFSNANSAIWGTTASRGTVQRQDFSAIWGTCGGKSGMWAPLLHASNPKPFLTVSRDS